MSGACSTDEMMRNACKILVDNIKGKGHLRDKGVYEKIILKWTLDK
jgi:hypothetical protein